MNKELLLNIYFRYRFHQDLRKLAKKASRPVTYEFPEYSLSFLAMAASVFLSLSVWHHERTELDHDISFKSPVASQHRKLEPVLSYAYRDEEGRMQRGTQGMIFRQELEIYLYVETLGLHALDEVYIDLFVQRVGQDQQELLQKVSLKEERQILTSGLEPYRYRIKERGKYRFTAKGLLQAQYQNVPGFTIEFAP